jgi:Transposase DDE domain
MRSRGRGGDRRGGEAFARDRRPGFEVGDGEVPRSRRGRRTRQIASAHDPEMRHGRQTAARPFTGDKIHAAAAVEAPILTSITLSPANEHDGHRAGALVDRQPQRRRPKRVIGDTAYGNVEVREELEKRSISVLAPVHSTPRKDGTIPKEAFAIDLETDTVTCPQGRPRRSTSPARIATDRFAKARSVGGWPSSRAATASPARCGSAARRVGSGISESGAARICAKPRFGRYPIPPSATISSAPGRESSGCSGSSSTATGGARAATSGPENQRSRQFGPPSWSTSTRSGPRCGPRRHRSEPEVGTLTRGHPRTGGRQRRPETLYFSGLRAEQVPRTP